MSGHDAIMKRVSTARGAVARRSASSGSAAHGFTVIEVLIAMTIMMIGAAAVITMQKTAIQANLDARKTDVANSIARMWTDRLRRDAMQWTFVPGNGNTATINNMAASFINNTPTTWAFPTGTIPTTTAPIMSYGFDILGRDLAAGDIAQSLFCVNVAITPLTTTPPALLRADVRVLWPRAISGVPPAFCTAVDQNMSANIQDYRAIYVTTTLSVNASQPQ
jgi:type II secretory pathway pseudopilin PulG